MESHDSADELADAQRDREEAEVEQARSASDDQEAAQHERRADKARYLREKLQERAESERDPDT
ncbi:MAG: hypothetical protein ACJ764_03730 [Solirubrobacteraceae bacterium]